MRINTKKSSLPRDNVFFTETALGIITVARSLITRDMGALVKKNKSSDELRYLGEAMKLLDIANNKVYDGSIDAGVVESIADFVNYKEYSYLFNLKNI